MNRQDILDKFVERVFDGTGQAIGLEDECAYYSSETDNCCGVGIFIEDCKDNPEIGEFVGDVTELIANFRDKLPEVVVNNPKMMNMLQRIHDSDSNWIGNAPSKTMYSSLKNLADDLALKLNVSKRAFSGQDFSVNPVNLKVK